MTAARRIASILAGSIGPTRRRCLAKLRRHPAIIALANNRAGDEE